MARPQKPDHILIETSGLALPKPLLKAFDWPAIRSQITVDGVIALADAEAVAEQVVSRRMWLQWMMRSALPMTASIMRRRSRKCLKIRLLALISCCCPRLILRERRGLAAARAVIEAEAPRKLPILPLTEGGD